MLVPVVQFDDPLSTVILDREGELLGATIAADGQWRFGVADTVPEKFVAAITCFEDRRFFRHPGVDPLAFARALAQNLRQGRVVSGGSTLTMQVVRLARRGRPRTYGEKAIEAALALRLSMSLVQEAGPRLSTPPTRPSAATPWASTPPPGATSAGPPARLSWAETATLAVLPNAPSLIHPGATATASSPSATVSSTRSGTRGTIDALTAELARREPLPPAPGAGAPPRPPPAGAGAGRAPRRLADRRRQPLGAHHPRRGRCRPGPARCWCATTAGSPRTGSTTPRPSWPTSTAGSILAYVGNLSRFDLPDHGHWVDVVPAPRSTGSVLKPLLYAAMLDAGEVLPGQLVPDVPTRLGSFHPENFDRTYAGAVPAERALARSLNVPAVRLLRSYGTDRFTVLLAPPRPDHPRAVRRPLRAVPHPGRRRGLRSST